MEVEWGWPTCDTVPEGEAVDLRSNRQTMGPALTNFKFLLYKIFLSHRVVVRIKGTNLNKCSRNPWPCTMEAAVK